MVLLYGMWFLVMDYLGEIKMTIPKWTEIRKENWRVEIDQQHMVSSGDMDKVAKDLNGLFREHKDWNNTQAYIEYDEIVYCKLCNQKYEPSYDEEKQREICSYCGGGLVEAAIKKMMESV